MDGSNFAEEEVILHRRAEELQSAIITVLFGNSNPLQLRLANDWITSFLASSLAWSACLYLSFPPTGSNVGLQQEVRFFSLNLLLSKIRTDWLQLAATDAREIYEVLIRHLPSNIHDKIVGARLCVVVGAAAGLAGADTCYELVESAIGESELQLPSKIDLLTALAEETLHRARNLSWEVRDCMQDRCPQVLIFLNTIVTSCGQSDILGNIFTCFERWIQAGVTLSELYSEYPLLFTSLLEALGSSIEGCFQAAVWALSELVSQVDILPGREAAVSALIKAMLAQKWQYDAATSTQIRDQNAGLLVRARGLCLLISEVGSVEGALVARSGTDGAAILEWLLDASRGGGGLGREGALMAVEAWPRLVAIPCTRRGELLNVSLFGAAAQSILQAAKYPPDSASVEDCQLEEEYFDRFRSNIQDGNLVALFKELKGAFLSLILEVLNGSTSWQDAEVCLFAAASISKDVINIINHQEQNKVPETSFLTGLFTWLLGSPSVRGNAFSQNEKCLNCSVLLLQKYAEWIASQRGLIEQSIQFVISALSISEVRVRAACALKDLCYTAASSLASMWPVELLIGNCEAALSVPTQLSKEEETQVQTVVVQGLASVAAALPATETEIALTRLSFGAITTLKELALGQGSKEQMENALQSALKVVSAAVEYGSVNDGRMHPALHLLQDIWPVLDSLTVTWAADAAVAAELCEFWGIVASKVGVSFVEVLPGIILAASSMFKSHQVAAPLSCLSKVVKLVSLRPTPELQKCLAAMLLDVTSILAKLDKASDDMDQCSHLASGSSALPNEQEDEHGVGSESSLYMMYELGRTFLQFFPAVILPSAAFLQIFSSATASISRKDPDVTLAAATFLSESILGPSGGKVTNKEPRSWNLSPELMFLLDQVVGYYGMLIVEAVLRRLAMSGVVEPLKEALADIFYGLCLYYSAITEAALISTLNAADFPGKCGFSLDSNKKQFLAAVLRRPSHPRVRFQELMRVFSGVCQALSSAEALQQF